MKTADLMAIGVLLLGVRARSLFQLPRIDAAHAQVLETILLRVL